MSIPISFISSGMLPRLAMPIPAQALQSRASALISGCWLRMEEAILQSRSLAAL